MNRTRWTWLAGVALGMPVGLGAAALIGAGWTIGLGIAAAVAINKFEL